MNPTLLYHNLRDVIPVKAGIQIASGPEGPLSGVEPGPEGKNWIPDQVRNDKMCEVIYETLPYRLSAICFLHAAF